MILEEYSLQTSDNVVAIDVKKFYTAEHTRVEDVTNIKEKNLFREHLYHMLHPVKTVKMVDEFISDIVENE